jgi:hypothetical protein
MDRSENAIIFINVSVVLIISPHLGCVVPLKNNLTCYSNSADHCVSVS